MSNLHVIQLVLAWAVFFCCCCWPGVATGGGGITFWGRRGKCVVCEENGKNTVILWSVEQNLLRKFLLLKYYHRVWFFGRQTFLWTVELTERDRNKNSCTGDEHGVVTGVVQTELSKVRNKKQYPYFSLFDTTFHWIMCHSRNWLAVGFH